MDTNPLRATFSLNHTEPTVFFTDGFSVPFSIHYKEFLWWKWWALMSYRINWRGRLVPCVVARHTCPADLLQIAQREYTRVTEEATEKNRQEIARG